MVSHDFYTVANCMDYVLFVEEKKLRKAEYEYGREQGREEGRIEGERSGRTHLLTLISQMSAGEDADKVTQLTDPEVLEAMMKKYGIE